MERRKPGEGSLAARGPSWTLRYQDAKGRRRITIGRLADMDETAARHKAEEFLHRVGRPSPEPEMTVSALVDDHLAELAGYCSKETMKSRRCVLMQAAGHFAGIPPSCVGEREAQLYVAGLAAKGLEASTIRHYAVVLSVLWEHAERRGSAQGNPWKRVRLPKPAQRDYQIIDAEEADRLVSACDPRIAPLVSVLAETGLRLGEALALRWQDVRMPAPGREGHFHVRKSKTRKPRVVWMTPRAVAAFAACRLRGRNGLEDRVCEPETEDGVAMSRGRLRSLFGSALTAAHLPHMRIHDLRHSFGYQLRESGANESDIADVLGHADTKTTAIYVRHKGDASCKRAIERLSSHQSIPGREAK